jgi:hypothetical protein
MRQLFTIQATETEGVIAENICHREQEFMQYQINIDNYTALLAKLPQEDWPEELKQYQGLSADRIPSEHQAQCNALNYRDRIRAILATEKQEQAKSEAVLDVLIDRIPQERRKAAIDAALLRIAERKNQG